MSLDNVIAVAAAAKGNTLLLIIGLAISIPLVVFASRLLLVLMERFPVIITLGAALLGWVAGDMAVTDPIDKPWVDAAGGVPALGCAAWSCAIAVVVVGKWLAARKRRRRTRCLRRLGRAARRRCAGPAETRAARGRRLRRRRACGATAARAARRPAAAGAISTCTPERAAAGLRRRVALRPGGTLEDYHRESSEKALAPARELLEAAGLSSPSTGASAIPAEHRRASPTISAATLS